MPKTSLNNDYYNLLSDLLKIKTAIQTKLFKNATMILAAGYWQMGKRLCKEDMFKKELTSQAGPVLSQLSQGLMMEYSLLTRVIKFYKIWPKECPVKKNPNVAWSHYKQLITLADEKERAFYLKGVQANNWKKTDLSNRIKSNYFEAIQKAGKTKIGPLKRSEDKMYCYSGKVIKVVDGDTLHIEVNLGFYVKMDVRLRLKGINTAELEKGTKKSREDAQKAKDFVSDKLKDCAEIVFQTFKVDSYGRYVAEVFYLPGETNKEKIVERGVFLNQELLDQGLAVRY